MDLLTINKNDVKTDEEHGPSVDADTADERIEARRLRIKKKKELTQMQLMGADLPVEVDKKKDLSKAREQIQASRARLVKLEKDGLELVTNIRVAGDAREHNRRIEEEESMRMRKERLEQEAKSSNEKFEEIVKKWENANLKEVPQELHDMLMEQKQLCDQMIEEKNKLINDFEFELKQKDDLYVKTLKKDAEDVDLLIERMKEQMRNMRKFYFEELTNIEGSFMTERKELLDRFRKEWEDKMNERRTKEVAFLNERFKRVEENEKQLHDMRVQDAEEYAEMKVKLETDVQILEQQLQQMKATYQLNQEKLEYNYRVLQKRDEENAKTKAQQKRKITKLQDTLTNLKNKIEKQKKQYSDENSQLADDYKRVTDMFTDLQHKSKHFVSVDLKKFHDIWVMNEEKAKELVSNLLHADRIIHEQQLGLKWLVPFIEFMDNIGPINSTKLLSGREFVKEVLGSQQGDEQKSEDLNENENEDELYSYEGMEIDANKVTAQPLYNEDADSEKQLQNELNSIKTDNHEIILNLSKNTLRNILMLLCDEGEFLVEQKLLSLLEPLEKNDRSMIKIDSIFKSLGVETETDVKLLAQYFVNHRQYLELIKRKSYIQPSRFRESATGPADENTSEAQRANHNGSDGSPSNNGGDYNKTTTTSHSQHSITELKTVPTEKLDLIHPNDVLRALKTFVTLHHKTESKKRIAKFRLNELDHRDEAGDQEYWARYVNVIDDKKEKLWEAILYALQKYNSVLIKRSQLIEDNESLELQNNELRILLAQYMQSPVNQELEIPPTKILQMEFSQ